MHRLLAPRRRADREHDGLRLGHHVEVKKRAAAALGRRDRLDAIAGLGVRVKPQRGRGLRTLDGEQGIAAEAANGALPARSITSRTRRCTAGTSTANRSWGKPSTFSPFAR